MEQMYKLCFDFQIPFTKYNVLDVLKIFLGRNTLQKCYGGRYLCNRGPECANYEVICPRAVTYYKHKIIIHSKHIQDRVQSNGYSNEGVHARKPKQRSSTGRGGSAVASAFVLGTIPLHLIATIGITQTRLEARR